MQVKLCLGSLMFMFSGFLVACGEMPNSGEASDSPALKTMTRPRGEARPAEPAVTPAGQDQAARAASTVYPAAHPSMPQITHHGGAVLHDPVLVTVTFPGDPYADKLRAFGEQVGGLDWWRAAVSPYGANPARSGGAVVAPEPAGASVSDAGIEDWLTRKIADGTFPAPTDQTLYILYYPQSTTVTLDDGNGGATSCQQFLGFHSAFFTSVNGRQMPVAYAVINRCSGFDQVIETSSHEIAEAASDPHPIDVDHLGYMLLESNAWTLLGGENADMCAGVSGVRENGWALTRVWNNEAAAQGLQPCVPVTDTGVPYFNAGILNDTIVASAGATVTTEIDCYAYGPLSAPMQLSLLVQGQNGLRFGLGQKTCQNGERIPLTIAVPANARRGSDYHYSLVSRIDDNNGHLWRGMVHVR